MQRELTIEDAVSDPLIALLRRADGISTPEFTRLLQAASETYDAGKQARHRSALCGKRAPSLDRPDEVEVVVQQDMARVSNSPKAGVPCMGW